MGDEWAEAMMEFDEAIWTAKEHGITKAEMLEEVENRYNEGD